MKERTHDVSVEHVQRLAELGMLTARFIHEARQPMFALRAIIDLVQRDPSRLQEYLPVLRDQLDSLDLLLQGYGDFSRRPTATLEIFDIHKPIRSALVILERQARLANVSLTVTLEDVPFVRGAMLAVQQAVVNLGRNAIEAVRGQHGRVIVGCEAHGEHVIVSIRDDGPGLPTEIRNNLFQPFRTTKSDGTGLGLVISRDLLQHSGAALQLRDGPGTWWECHIPVA